MADHHLLGPDSGLDILFLANKVVSLAMLPLFPAMDFMTLTIDMRLQLQRRIYGQLLGISRKLISEYSRPKGGMTQRGFPFTASQELGTISICFGLMTRYAAWVGDQAGVVAHQRLFGGPPSIQETQYFTKEELRLLKKDGYSAGFDMKSSGSLPAQVSADYLIEIRSFKYGTFCISIEIRSSSPVAKLMGWSEINGGHWVSTMAILNGFQNLRQPYASQSTIGSMAAEEQVWKSIQDFNAISSSRLRVDASKLRLDRSGLIVRRGFRLFETAPMERKFFSRDSSTNHFYHRTF
jgi:hypothetical protein